MDRGSQAASNIHDAPRISHKVGTSQHIEAIHLNDESQAATK